MPNTLHNILSGFGSAWYLHKGLCKRAERAKQAVDYLVGKGLFKQAYMQQPYMPTQPQQQTVQPSNIALGTFAGGLGGAAVGEGAHRYITNRNRNKLIAQYQAETDAYMKQINDAKARLGKATKGRGLGGALSQTAVQERANINKLYGEAMANRSRHAQLAKSQAFKAHPAVRVGATLLGSVLGGSLLGSRGNAVE